jgi:hypothetical protein
MEWQNSASNVGFQQAEGFLREREREEWRGSGERGRKVLRVLLLCLLRFLISMAKGTWTQLLIGKKLLVI